MSGARILTREAFDTAICGLYQALKYVDADAPMRALRDHDEALRELVKELAERLAVCGHSPSDACSIGGCHSCFTSLELLARARAVIE